MDLEAVDSLRAIVGVTVQEPQPGVLQPPRVEPILCGVVTGVREVAEYDVPSHTAAGEPADPEGLDGFECPQPLALNSNGSPRTAWSTDWPVWTDKHFSQSAQATARISSMMMGAVIAFLREVCLDGGLPPSPPGGVAQPCRRSPSRSSWASVAWPR